MQKKIDFSLLRNPVFVIGCYILLLLPEFVSLCTHNKAIPSFWENIPVCSKQFVWSVFLRNSTWSLILILFVFEAFRFFSKLLHIDRFPKTKRDWLLFQAKLMLPTVFAFVLYFLLTFFFEWIKNRGFVVENIAALSIFFRVLFVSYVGVNVLLLWNSIKDKKNPLLQNITVQGPLGEIPLSLTKVLWFEKKGRSYFVNSNENEFQIASNLSTLEESLCNKHFARINRAVIVNVSAVKNYSHWENEKYILKLISGQEFVVTRKRIVALKSMFKG